MTPELEIDAILSVLKRMLRERGASYGALAEHLGVSVPTVKRMLNGGPLTLESMANIASFVGSTLFEVAERAASEAKPRHTMFDEAQDALFFEQPEMLAYFEELAAGRTPQAIAAQHGLTKASTVKYLHALERVGLLDALPFDKVRLRVKPPVGFGRNSRYLKRELRAQVEALVEKVFVRFDAPRGNMVLVKPLRLPRSVHRALATELRELIDRYAALEARLARLAEDEGDPREATMTVVLHDAFEWPVPPIKNL